MSEGPIRPEHFMGSGPLPRRPGGTEAEYDTQHYNDDGTPSNDPNVRIGLLTSRNVRAAGIVAFQPAAVGPDTPTISWLTNGGSMQSDCGLVEVSTGETLDPSGFAAASFAGMENVVRLCRNAKLRSQLYQCSASVKRESTGTITWVSLGHHESHMAPAAIANQRTADLIDAYLTTRVWAWAGIVAKEGFRLSQKEHGIGMPTTMRAKQATRTKEGQKPLAWMRPGESDLFRDDQGAGIDASEYMRNEFRGVDGVFSWISKWLSAATGSLVLRFSEQHRVFNKNDHPFNMMTLPYDGVLQTYAQASRDLTLKRPVRMRSGKWMSPTNVQELIVEYGDYLRQRVELTPQEYHAVDVLAEVCSRMHQTDILGDDLGPILGIVDFAPRIVALRKNFEWPTINLDNKKAVGQSMAWNRVYPEGPGYRYWKNIHAKGSMQRRGILIPVDQALIDYHVDYPDPNTRAAVRGALVADERTRRLLTALNWPFVNLGGSVHSLGPYQNDVRSIDHPLIRERFGPVA